MSARFDLVREAFRTEERGVDRRAGLAGALATVGPLAIGLAVGEPAAGLAAGLGGLNVALCVPHAAVRARLWWGMVALLGQAAAVVIAAATGTVVGLVLLSAGWVAVWAFFRATGPAGALVGFVTSATFVIFAGVDTPLVLRDQLACYLLGGSAGLALMVVARRAERDIPVGGDGLRVVRSAMLHDRGMRAHSVRLAVAVGSGSLLYRVVDLPHGYWVPLTTLAILEPTEHGTLVRSAQRAAGTVVAALLMMGILFLTANPWPLVACAAIAAFLLFTLDERGYFWLVVLLTPTVLLMISAVVDKGEEVVLDRIVQTMIGIVIGLAIAEVANAVARIRPEH